MSLQRRPRGRLWPGSDRVSPLCVILRPWILFFVCVLNATLSGAGRADDVMCLMLGPPSASARLEAEKSGCFYNLLSFFVFLKKKLESCTS